MSNAEPQDKGFDVSNTAGRKRGSLEYISYWKWQGNSELHLSATYPKTLPKFVYSNEAELGPKCNQRHLVCPNTNSETAITSVLRYVSFPLKKTKKAL